MMSYARRNVFSQLIPVFFRNLKVEVEDGTTLYIFQGFPLTFYQELQKFLPHMIRGVHAHYPSAEEFLSESDELTRSFFTLTQSVWIYYEELIVMRQTLHKFSVPDHIVVVYNDVFDNSYPLPLGERDYSALQDDKIDQEELPLFHLYVDCPGDTRESLCSFIHCHSTSDVGREDVKEVGFYGMVDTKNALEPSNVPDDAIRITRMELPHYAERLQRGELENRTYRVVGMTDGQLKCIRAMNTLGGVYHVYFVGEAEGERSQEVYRYLPTFQKYWGAGSTFRSIKFYKDPLDPENYTETEDVSQGIIVSDILDQCEKAQIGRAYSDIIVTAPTGAGKSVLFQVPAIYLSEQSDPYVTIVISPLVVLMADQVRELEEKGIHYATFINSNITYEERQKRLSGIKAGTYSIVYLSPELLLAHSIQDLFGERNIGLMIVDEAHLVTSWGRDFRVDYWFLGSYITGVRQNQWQHSAQMQFPVVCLTATAVYGGDNDVIDDLQESLNLNCEQRHMYLGYVVRDNIDFSIRGLTKDTDSEAKVDIVAKRIADFVSRGEKTIVYFPYTRQIDEVYQKLTVRHEFASKRTTRYYGGMESKEKQAAYESFLCGESIVMLATKAFGMGVNIPDILNVYHYAPTGTLADYVQEIGRAARKLPQGHASIDFAVGDMKSVRRLWGMSSLRQYQLKSMMKKLYTLYAQSRNASGKRTRNLLIAADEFDFLFDSKDIDNAVKTGLMLLSTDLYRKYRFKVITMRPRVMLTMQYISIPPEVEKAFLRQYGDYCERVNDVYPRNEGLHRTNPIAVSRTGGIYEVELNRLWERGFDTMTFAQFKYKFFNGELFGDVFHDVVFCPHLRLVIHYTNGYEKAQESMVMIAKCLQDSFSELKREYGARMFSFQEFKTVFNRYYGRRQPDEYIRLLLELFVGETESGSTWDPPKGDWKFLIKRKKDTSGKSKTGNEVGYMISGGKATSIGRKLEGYLQTARPNINGQDFVVYIPILSTGQEKPRMRKPDNNQFLASVLQIFDLASYEVEGGRNPQIFVRINDPGKLQQLSMPETKYRNTILEDINQRHENAIRIMNGFMTKSLTTERRWAIIEQYFLGKDEWVCDALISSAGTEVESVGSAVEKPHTGTNTPVKVSIIGGNTPADMGVTGWRELGKLLTLDLSNYEKQGIPLPTKVNFQVEVGVHSYGGLFLWEQSRTMVLPERISNEDTKSLGQDHWCVQLL